MMKLNLCEPRNQREARQCIAIREVLETSTQLLNGLITYEEFASKIADTAAKTPKLENGDIDPITGLRMRLLKHADKAAQGEFIRSLDFGNLGHTYIEGRVLETNAKHPDQGVPCYKIIVIRDVHEYLPYLGKGCRAGHIAWVPHEVAMLETDGRVSKVTFTDGDVDSVYVDQVYRNANLPKRDLADALALVANANESARVAREGCFPEQPNAKTMLHQWVADELLQTHRDQQAEAAEQAR